MLSARRHACYCCGYLVHEVPCDGGSNQVCPICAWCDDAWSSWNVVPIENARQNVAVCGAMGSEFMPLVRCPTPHDLRDPFWVGSQSTLEALRAQVFIDFAGVRRCNGTSLQEAEWRDAYMPYTSVSVDAADPEIDWFDILDEKLERYHWGNWCFIDRWGLRFYLPRYLVRHLDVLLGRRELIASLFALWRNLATRVVEVVPLLTSAQHYLVARVAAAIAYRTDALELFSWQRAWLAHASLAGTAIATARAPRS